MHNESPDQSRRNSRPSLIATFPGLNQLVQKQWIKLRALSTPIFRPHCLNLVLLKKLYGLIHVCFLAFIKMVSQTAKKTVWIHHRGSAVNGLIKVGKSHSIHVHVSR